MRKVMAVLAITSMLASACGSSDENGPLADEQPEETTYKGYDDDALAETLSEAETETRSFAEANHGVVSDDMACWAQAEPEVDGVTELKAELFCGPVLFPWSDEDEFWMTPQREPKEPEGSRSRGETPSTTGLREPMRFLRPDGRQMPEESGLEVPDPPPASTDLFETFPDDRPIEGVDLDPPEDTRLTSTGAKGDLRSRDVAWVEKSGVVPVYTGGFIDGPTWIGPPEGHDLVVLSAMFDSTFTEDTTVTIGDRRPVKIDPARTGRVGVRGVHLVAAAPKGDDVILTLRSTWLGTLRYDVRAGKVID